ncbi:MAG: carboxyl-terminal processing protease [Solirubrobacteraceae bacterium]|nr:carboxyl-terminal processing protease [Solirubrobacteraceae bacterium]
MDRLATPVIALVCAILALAAGLYLGGHPGDLPTGLRKVFVEDDRATRVELINQVEHSFYKKVSRKQLEEASLKGIVDSLHDQFSHYLTPAEAKLFRQSLSHGFEGVGMTINANKRGLRVVMVFDGSPAKRAGIRKDDLIVAVNGRSIAGVPSSVATGRIKGPAGTTVNLSVLSPGASKPRVLRVPRERITVPIATGKLIRHKGVPLAYVRLAAFDSGAHAAVADQLQPLLKKGAKGIVLDLRGNPGGLLEEGVLTASLFIENGPIVSTSGRTQPKHVFDAEGQAIAPTQPMVVLVDKGSASAAEIVTGALRDHNRATVVGEKTYGKGVFQNVLPLQNGGILDLTVGSYFLPKGSNLAHKGIQPTAPARDLPKTRRDEALPVALDVLYAKVR